MKYKIAESVHTSLYIILFIGICVLFKNDIKAFVWRLKMMMRLKTRSKIAKENIVRDYLNLLIRTTISERFSATHLLVVSVIIFCSVLITGLRSYKLHTAAFFGILIGIMPYLLLRIRLENMRHKASFEGEVFVTSLLSKYRMTSFNMQRALELLIEDEKMPTICKNLLVPAIMKARVTGDRHMINCAFNEFNFAINTNWSRMISYNIALAFSTGIDVTNAIEDIMLQLREARMIAEERKRLNSEASRLVLFMVPVSYGMSLLLAVKYVGVSPGDVLKNQFFTPQGFAFFIFILFMFLINTALLKAIENQRFDY